MLTDTVRMAEESGLAVEPASFPNLPDVKWYITDKEEFFEICRSEEELLHAVESYRFEHEMEDEDDE